MTTRNRVQLNADDRDVITFLLREVDDSYRRSKRDRAELHRREWAEGGGGGSVLGEGEVRADVAVGVARTWLKIGVDASPRADLERSSVHCSATLREWLQSEAAAYPEYVAHLSAVEHLRAFAYRVLVMSAADGGEADRGA